MNRSPRASQARPAVPRLLRDAWALDALQAAGLIRKPDIDTLRADAPEWVASAVVARGLAPADQVATCLAKAARVPVANLDHAEPGASQFIPEATARQYVAFPLAATARSIRIATANPMDMDAERDIGFATSRTVEFAYALPDVLRPRIEDVFRPERSIERLVSGLHGEATLEVAGEEPEPEAGSSAVEAPAAKLVEATIADAVREGASDLHLEPTAQGLVIRYRVDGVLREVMRVPRLASPSVTRRLKVTAGLDVTDPLHPHDGRATARVDGKPWDLRVSSIPIARLGEKIVVRLLDPGSAHLKLDAMGLAPDDRKLLDGLLGHREGIVLVTGPTGSGKTSTLYAMLDAIRTPGLNVVTVEDPVEYRLPGVSQIEVNEKQGFTFASALRSVLRQDPDIVLLGEIRDLETAQTAWQAALSGHFVLSTLHTNDAVSAVMRLRDIGVEGFKIAAALKGVVAQRLMRRLCPHCAAAAAVDSLPAPARPPAGTRATVKKPVGCAKCSASGYRGRFAIEEVLAVDAAIANLIAEGATGPQLLEAGRKKGMRTLWESAMRRVWAGEAGYDEVVRVVGEPSEATEARDVPEVTESRRSDDEAQTPADDTPLVLIVDDDPAMRAVEAATLLGEGFRTEEAVDGRDALLAVQRLHPTLILLDMEMPNLGGFEVLGALREKLATKTIPVIVVTSKDDAETEGKCIELGADDYIVKPIRPPALLARVRAVLRRVAAV